MRVKKRAQIANELRDYDEWMGVEVQVMAKWEVSKPSP